MSFLDTLENVVKGVATGITVVTVLPVLGAAGTITAAGVAVGKVLGELLQFWILLTTINFFNKKPIISN